MLLKRQNTTKYPGNSNLKIQKANLNNAEEIQSLVASLSSFYLEKPNSVLPDWFKETIKQTEIEKRLLNGEYKNYVYLKEGKIIGYIAIKTDGHLYHLFVKKECQGKGIARALWSYANEIVNCHIYTVNSSIFAVPIYEQFGFIISGDISEKDGIKYQPMKLVQYEG